MDRLQEIQPLKNRVVVMLADGEVELMQAMKDQDHERYDSRFLRVTMLKEAERRGLLPHTNGSNPNA